MDRTKRTRLKDVYRELLLYFMTVLAIILTWCIVLQVWRADWSIPFDYGTELGTDVLGISTWLKSYNANGFSKIQTDFSVPFFTNRMEGFGIDRVILLMEIICVQIFPTYGGALNFLYLLSFVLTGMTTVYALRSLKVSRLPSFAGAIIYTFLQYHLMRGEMHIFLSFYYMVPISVLMMLWLIDESFLTERFSHHVYGRVRYANIIFGFTACLLGMENPYYTFFAAIGIGFAVLYNLLHGQFKKMVEGIEYLLVIALTTVAFNLEALFNTSDVAMEYLQRQRTVESIEFFGLKIVNLLLPVQKHRLPILARVRQYYDELVGSQGNEGAWISLGLVLTVCFCVVIIYCLVEGKMNERLKICGRYILAFVLVSTIGGVSSVIGFFFSLLRCYNRTAVFIAMFCVIAFAILVEKLGDFMVKKNIMRSVYIGAVMALTAFAVWDQTTAENVYAYEATKEEYVRDEEFVKAIESIMPQNSSIFELPLMPSGQTAVHDLRDYELYKPFLHAESTRWLHMYAVGSQTDQWADMLYRLPLRMAIDVIASCGFEGIYIDSRGYDSDEFERVLTVMNSLSGTKVLWSEDGTKVFYSIVDYTRKLKERLGDDKIQELSEFWLSNPEMTCFLADQLHYTKEVKRQGDEAVMPYGCIQYGPYVTVQKGDYIAFVIGRDQNRVEHDVVYAEGTAKIPIEIRDSEEWYVEYTFCVEEELPSVELRCINRGAGEASIRGIILLNADEAEKVVMIRDFLKWNVEIK